MIHNRILIGGVIFSIALSMPFYGHTWNLFMHQLGAVLFLGNVMVSSLWMSLAKRVANPEALRLGVRGVLLTDAVFATPGALLLLLNGGILGTPFFRTGAMWLFLGIGLFLVSFIIWLAVLLPTQRRLWRAVDGMHAGGAVPAECAPLLARWFRVGGVATLFSLAALVLMVFKPVF
jgi:uncharacterized membrane protein